jgi:hypothetical protein
VPAIRVYDTTATEASGNAAVRVTLSTASGRTVSVVYKTQEGTALDTLDYMRIVADTLVFQPGETQKFINVSILPDQITEGNETFSAILQSPVNGTVTASQGGDNTAIIIIQNSVFSGNRAVPVMTPDTTVKELLVQQLEITTSPNPFRDHMQFRVVSPETGSLKILVYDASGIRIAELKQDVTKNIPATIPMWFTQARQGTLFYKAFVNKQSVTGKLLQIN